MTENHRNKAAGSGCHDAACSAGFFLTLIGAPRAAIKATVSLLEVKTRWYGIYTHSIYFLLHNRMHIHANDIQRTRYKGQRLSHDRDTNGLETNWV